MDICRVVENVLELSWFFPFELHKIDWAGVGYFAVQSAFGVLQSTQELEMFCFDLKISKFNANGNKGIKIVNVCDDGQLSTTTTGYQGSC